MKSIYVSSVLAAFLLTGVAYAEDPVTDAVKTKEAETDFKGLGFGVGVSLTIDGGKQSRIDDAELVAGVDEHNNPVEIVRVKSVRDRIPRIMLESHYFFGLHEEENKARKRIQEISPAALTEATAVAATPEKVAMYGLGPFVAVQPGSNEIIEAIGMGVMFGMRRAQTRSDSFNIAVGYVVDPRVKVLGDGIEPNKPLPAGEKQLRFKTTSQSGLLILFSFAF